MAAGSGVTFVSLSKKSWPICHVCGKQHEGSYPNCRSTTDEPHNCIGKIAEAREFNDKTDNSRIGGGGTRVSRVSGGGKPNRQTKGVAKEGIKEEDDG